MKRNTLSICLLALMALGILWGCGQKSSELTIGPDGYGKTILANGITVVINRDETTSLTSGRFLIGGGVVTETADKNGITNLMIRMMLKGNDKMSASEITERLDYLGANVSASCFRDYSAISFTSLTENFNEVLDIITTSVMSPAFPEDELTKLKLEVDGEIKASDDSQSAASSKLFWRTAYGDAAYGLPTVGTAESIERITTADIRSHFEKYVGGKNIVFSISTDLPVDQIATLLDSKISGIRSEAEKVTAPQLTLQAEKTGFISFDRNQSFIYMGYTMNHLNADEVAYVIMLNEVMGGSVSSRLWYLRQKEKLAYAIYTQYALDKFDAIFRSAIGTDTSKVNLALEALEREWAKLIDEGITADELADAKVNMKNNLIFQIDTKSGRTNNMAYYEYLGYGYKFPLELIKAADRITLDGINGFVKTKLDNSRRYVSIVGKM